MKEDIKAEWIKRLRSGDYPQGTMRLRTDEGFCCLGVLCEIAVEEGIIEYVRQEDFTCHHIYDGTETAILPVKVVEWAGLDSASPSVGFFDDDKEEFPSLDKEDTSVSLASLNDSGASFSYIADKIENNL